MPFPATPWSTPRTRFDDPLALSMLIDVFSGRGFHSTIDKTISEMPSRVDLATGKFTVSKKWCTAFT